MITRTLHTADAKIEVEQNCPGLIRLTIYDVSTRTGAVTNSINTLLDEGEVAQLLVSLRKIYETPQEELDAVGNTDPR